MAKRQAEGKNKLEIIRCLAAEGKNKLEIIRCLGTSPEKSTASSPTRHQPRTAPAYAPTAEMPASPSPTPPKPSEPTPPASQNSNEAATTTTTSLPDTRDGSEPTNPPRHRFDNRRSIFMGLVVGVGRVGAFDS